ncbi:helix-turn-helix domain-containing protein [Acidiferrobacter sp.]|uniref:ArsR/SmtB family transcription factor n=1 Tax=Acidiferrobacter sp. TaxID=1872107 RepID=UPI0026253826|nr:helix-turn-helix domain-containing protein [Acidiferrobacter sp.]
MTMKITAATRALTALAQETRLGIVRLLVKVGPSGLVAGQIALRLKLAPATSSFHLSQLTQAGLIKPSREGRSIRYSPVLGTISELLGFLEENLSGGPTEKSVAKAPVKSAPKAMPKGPAKGAVKTGPAKKKAGRKRR